MVPPLPAPKLNRGWRRLVQAGFWLFSLYTGFCFYRFFLWATGSGPRAARPPAVEAFLPVGALVSLKQLLLTGVYDPVHPAGLTVFIAALAVAFFFRKSFCGWICPVGFTAELAHAAVSRVAAAVRGTAAPRRRLPAGVSYPLLGLKYLLLAFFLYLVGWKMDLRALQGFINSPYNLTVAGRMLHFFLAPSSLALGVISCLVVLSLIWRGFWCRFLCPYGALLGLLALAGPLQVRRAAARCVDCKKCEQVCPAAIKITARETLVNPECVGCLDCLAVCPEPGCLSLTVWGRKRVSWWLLPAGMLLLFLGLWVWARLSGHWQTRVPDAVLWRFYHLLPF